MTPVAPKKRTVRSAKQATCANRSPEPKQSHPGSHAGGPEVIDVLLDISNRFQAREAYIASQQETERVNHTGGATQPTGAEGSKRGSN